MSEEKPTKQKRKSRNTGQVIERGPDKYLIRVFLGRDSAGKRHYHDETFHGKKRQAQDRLRVLLTKHKAGESLKINKDTLGVFLDEWLGANPDLKESSIAHYKRTLDLYVRPKLGNLRRKVPFNPMDGVDAPGGKRAEEEKKANRAARVMTPDQVAQFLAAAEETRFGTLFTLAFHTGCRPGELLGLKWSNLDAGDQTLKISQAINWRLGKKPGEPEWYLDTPKTAHGRRVLRLTDGLLEVLTAHRKRQLEERMKAGRVWNDHDFIFADEIGEPYSQNRLRYYCKQILKAAGLPEHFNPYSARHTSATLLMAGGINAKTVSERLGHSDVNITLQTYTHPTADMQTEASERIERALQDRK